MELKRVVVTGIGTINPLGNNVPLFWEGLRSGVSSADYISRFDATLFHTQIACEVKNFNPAGIFDRKELKKMDLFSQFAVVASDEAIAHSQLDLSKEDSDRIGVIWGVGVGGVSSFLEESESYFKQGSIPNFSPFIILRLISNMAPSNIAIRHHFTGPNYVTTSACASSGHAIYDAFNLIRLGKSDVIIAGGSEATTNAATIGGFGSMKALSTRNNDPKSASRPFDKDRDGFVLGEGAAALVLESYDHAVARGAHILAELAGGACNCDAFHLAAPDSEGNGAAKVMRLALEDAEMEPEEVDYINVHGTSTPVGDIVEPKAIVNVFGEHAYNLHISSTKSMTGHLLGAAAAIESIVCILAIQNELVPPTINLKELDPVIDSRLDFTPNVAVPCPVRVAMNNAFGFGGENACLIFKK